MFRTTLLAMTALTWCSAAAAQDVARVGNGLRAPVSVAGEAPRTMRLADRMAHYKVPALSIAVIDHGRIAWVRAYGTLALNDARRATPRTLFQAGSLSKPVSAAAALRLVYQGKLSLDAPVNDRLTSWKVPASDAAQAQSVTLRRILSHSAGLTVSGFRGYEAGTPLPTLLQILDGTPPAISAPIRVDQVPGSAVRYSGGGYIVMQQLIQDVANRPFADFMQSALLHPLGMADSSYAQPLPAALAPRAAIGHKGDGSAVPGGWHVHPYLAAGGLWSTAGDLARFALWVMNGMKPGARGEQSAVAHWMLEPQRDPTGKPFTTPAGNRSGLGVVVEGEGATLRFTHSGSNSGYRAFMIGFPGTGQGAVFMANSDTSPALIQEVMRGIAAEYHWPERFQRVVELIKLDDAALAARAGTYSFKPRGPEGRTAQIVVQAEPGLLLAALPDGSHHRLRAISPTTFLDPDTDMTLVFGEDGTVRVPAYEIVAKRD